MLAGAAVPFVTQDSGVDESALKLDLADVEPVALALELARAKALAVSQADPDAWVLGSDQILDLGGRLMSKAPDLVAARERLEALRGGSHSLHSAAALARDGVVVWSGVDTARMIVRDFSDDFLDAYLMAEGEALLGSVGCYRLEGPGAQLFDQIDGDYFTVLGMPLWPVLEELRRVGVIQR